MQSSESTRNPWQRDLRDCCTLNNPRGGLPEERPDPRMPDVRIPRRVMEGGSYLCGLSLVLVPFKFQVSG